VKNFPHQYSDFAKLRGTLATISDLNAAGQDVGDDGVLGYELTRRGINTLRERPDLPLEDRIALIQRRPSGSQGPRTAAREMRRTLLYLGWLDDAWRIRDEGRAFLATDFGSEGERAMWQRALLELSLEDTDGNVSHPIRILLRLVQDHQIVERQGAELALEARDDSDDEYQRVSALVSLPETERIAAIGSSEAAVRDARKILPAFAEQANLIHRASRSAPYTLTEAGIAALGEGFESRRIDLRDGREARTGRRARGAPRTARSDQIRRVAPADPEAWRSLSHEEQIAATRLRFERTVRHQNLVARLLEIFQTHEGECFEDTASFDFTYVPSAGAPIVVFEVKTLEADELTQTRLAVGQLLSYEFLNVRPRWPDRDIALAVVYEREVDPELVEFLDAIHIAAMVLDDGGLRPLNDTARELPI
jgi:hypothetical protein